MARPARWSAMHAGDGFAFYSPRTSYSRWHAAAGVYRHRTRSLGNGLSGGDGRRFSSVSPRRRFSSAEPAPVKPLLPALSFIRSKTHWGAAFRFGVVRVPAADFAVIAAAMKRSFAADFSAPVDTRRGVAGALCSARWTRRLPRYQPSRALSCAGNGRDCRTSRPTSSTRCWRRASRCFTVEQHCAFQDADGYDLVAWHLLGWTAGTAPAALAAYLRILDPGSKYAEPSIGRVLTMPPNRGTGLGRVLMEEGVARCFATWPGQSIRIAAQQRLEAFYQSLSFRTVSPPYVEDGIPHVDMMLAA